MTDVPLLNAMIFAVLGLTAFAVALTLFIKLSPWNFWQEILEKQNIAAALFAAAVALGICWIIAAAVH